jgi:hypothetical protein
MPDRKTGTAGSESFWELVSFKPPNSTGRGLEPEVKEELFNHK